MRKAGTIYVAIAAQCLEAWYSDMSKEEREALLARADYDELEGYVYAESSIRAAIRGLSVATAKYWEKYLPKDFENFVLFGEQLSNNSEEELANRKELISSAAPEIHGDIIVTSLVVIHDQWVKDNTKKFFDPKRENKQYMFTHVFLIGWEEAKKDLIFLEPILNYLGIPLSTLEEVYNKQAQNYITDNQITKENLPDFIGKGDYYALDDSISEHLKTNSETCQRIATQVATRSSAIC